MRLNAPPSLYMMAAVKSLVLPFRTFTVRSHRESVKLGVADGVIVCRGAVGAKQQ